MRILTALISLTALAASAAAQPAPTGDAYQAAFNAARQEFREQRFAEASASWRRAADLSAAAPGDPPLARANALIAESVSLFYDLANSRGASAGAEQRADNALAEAMRILAPSRNDRAFGEALNQASNAYAAALAWRASHDTRRALLDRPRTRTVAADGCETDVIAEPPPRERLRAIQPWGSVVVRFHIDASGAIARREIVTAAPPTRDLTDMIEPVINRWTITRRGACSGAYAAFAVVRFGVP